MNRVNKHAEVTATKTRVYSTHPCPIPNQHEVGGFIRAAVRYFTIEEDDLDPCNCNNTWWLRSVQKMILTISPIVQDECFPLESSQHEASESSGGESESDDPWDDCGTYC